MQYIEKTCTLTTIHQYWTFRIPNYCKMDSRPFHPDTYVGPEQDDDENLRTATREKSMGIKLEVQSTVRWRWTQDENGQPVSVAHPSPSDSGY